VICPPAELLEMFEGQANDLVGQIGVLIRINDRLKQARDMLLPRLMSGEIEV